MAMLAHVESKAAASVQASRTRWSEKRGRVRARAAGSQEQAGTEVSGAAATEEEQPTVKLDNLDPFATVLTVQYGNKLGQLLDTTSALKDLGLSITRASFDMAEGHRFFITDASTGNKITDSGRLEDIRMTVINNLMHYHPESMESLSQSFRSLAPEYEVPKKKEVANVRTRVDITSVASGARSEVRVETADRPGLLMDIVATLKDLSLDVVSAEVDTLGSRAVDSFYVQYRGVALNHAMEQLVINTLKYHLDADTTEEGSF